jgi:thermitase
MAGFTSDPFTQPPDEVIIKFHPGTPAAAQREAHQQVNGRVVEQLDGVGVTVVEVGVGSVTGAIEVYERNPNVVYAEPNHHRLLFRPVTTEGSEPTLGVSNNFDEQWALTNTGQGFGATVDPLFGTLIHPTYQGTSGADINAEAGWAGDRHGSPSVAIAVLDSGVDCNHSDLLGKCLEQLNFVAEHGSSNTDLIGHGTHVAGIAAAHTDNGIGIAGVSWDTSIGSMKVCWEDTSLAILGIVLAYCDDADIAEAIDYAANSGLYQVINMSLAGPEFSITLQNAIDQAWDAGLVIVAGAGNEYSDTIMYPAGYANVIAVGSSDQHDNLSYFSSFGSWVSVLAPGSAIFSTIPGEFCGQPSTESSDCYDWKSGTSMSAPHVAGLAALLWAHKTGATNANIRNAIQDAATTVGVLGQNFQAWSQYGRIDMGSALSVSITELEPTAHHVDALTASTINIGRGSKQGQIQVSIRDDLGNPVPGATVSGIFSGSFAEAASGVTNGSGEAILSTTDIAKGGVAFSFCVTDVTGATAYDPSMNLVTCVDF